MLVETGCSIYAERPQTCRSYDCRVFAATGVQPDQPAVAERVREWRFTLGEGDAARLAALRAAAAWLAAHPDEIPEPRTALQRAAHAVMIHERFLG
jgi:Fe-S-cluster containining protein